MQNISSPRAVWLTLSDPTRSRIRDIALVCALFAVAFSATIVMRLAIALAFLADGFTK
jgi:hypothetical protein